MHTPNDPASELRTANAALARLRQVVDHCPDVFYAVDHDGTILMANRAAAMFITGKPDNVEGANFLDVSVKTDVARQILQEMRDVMNHGRPVTLPDVTVEHADGTPRAYRYREIPFIDELTGNPAVVGVATDITGVKEHERVRRDLEIARSIQHALLPDDSLTIPGFAIAGWSQAADHTGGDHYDWLPIADDRVVVTLADVSGHGIGPAIVTAVCRAYARATIDSDQALHDVVARINEFLFDDLPADRFITFAAAIVDPASSAVNLLSAGHGPTLLARHNADSIETIEAHGPPLAVLPDASFDQASRIDMNPGDSLVLISDGFLEFPDAHGTQFGVERIQQTVIRHAHEHPSQVINALRRDVATHAGAVSQPDDMTVVIIQKT